MNRILIPSILLSAWGFIPVMAQEPLLVIEGTSPWNRLAEESFDFAGDVNGDGYDDILTSASDWLDLEYSFFQIHSGVDGSQLHSWRFGVGGDYAIPWSCSTAGDMDGDGLADVVLGGTTGIDGFYGAEDFVEVRSGGSGQVIHRWAAKRPLILGSVVRGGGDVDGDGVPDVIAREYDSSWGARVNVYSGSTGQVLYVLDRNSNPNDWSWNFGRGLDFCGDLNGDGCDEFIVGDPDSSLGGSRFGAAFVFSGVDGSLLFQFAGTQTYSEYGISVAGPGDMNGDGVPDLAVGAPRFFGVGVNSGQVQVFSGADGVMLFQMDGANASGALGIEIESVGDVNADGRADLVIFGELDPPAGVVLCRVFSGLDGSVLTSQGGSGLDNWGDEIAGGGDLNGDGFPDFAVSAPEYLDHTGRIYIYPGNPVLQVDPMIAGQHTDFQVTHFANDKKVGLAYSVRGWGSTSVPQLGLDLDLLWPVLVAGPTFTDTQGQLTWRLRVPVGAVGIPVWLQAAQYGLKTNVVSQTIQ
jgi:FG-GAP repeat protein